MRFALLVEPLAADSIDRSAALRRALARAGFNVVRLRPGLSLRRDLERAIEVAEDSDAALVYVAGDVRLGAEGASDAEGVVLAGDPPLSFVEIARVIRARRLAHLLFVVDGRAEGEKADALSALEHVEAIVHALAPKEGVVASGPLPELLAAVETGPRDSPRSLALTRFFVLALEDAIARATEGTMHLSSAYAKMKAHPEFASSVSGFAHVSGSSDFVVVAPVAERVSEPPPPSRISALPPSARARGRAILPLPAIEPILASAERARAEARWDEALEAYRKALMLLADGSPVIMASIYASVAEVKLAQGKRREAETSYEKALAASPDHVRSLTALVKLSTDGKEWVRAAGFERQLARALHDDDKRVEAFARAAELYEQARDLGKAAEVLEEARAVKPGERVLLVALRAAYEALRQWRKVVDVVGLMAEAEPLLHDKAQRRFEQAEVLLTRLRDEDAGLAALAAVLEDDPTHERALAGLVSTYTRRQAFGALDKVYAHLVDSFAARDDAARAWEICKKLGVLRRDKLGDGPGALDAFLGAVKLRPKDVETRAALAELLVAKGDRPAAIAELETAALTEPGRAETYRRLFELHRRAGATDRAWLAATALEELGAANVDQAMLVDQFRGEGKPTSTLSAEAWSLLRAQPGSDPIVEAIVTAIASAAVTIKVAALRAEKKLVVLDPERRQAEDSTATLARTFGFVSRVLGVKAPALYAEDGDAPKSGAAYAQGGVLLAAQVAEPSTVFGEAVMRGRKVPELSFLAARHLTYYRPEYYPLVFYPTLPELTGLVLAAIKLAKPELPLPPNTLSVSLRRELLGHATEAEKAALAAAVEELDARGGKLDLAAWVEAVERTANRAGLLVAGDLSIALGAMKGEERTVGGLTFEERRGDLLAFAVSGAHAELRAALGLAARPSRDAAPASAAPA